MSSLTHTDRILAEFSDLPPHIRKLAKTAHETSENEEEFRDRLKSIRVLANLCNPKEENKTMDPLENLPPLMHSIRASIANAKPMPPALPTLQLKDCSIRTVPHEDDLWLVAKDCTEALGIVWKGKETLSSIPEGWIRVLSLRTHKKNRDGSTTEVENDSLVINEKAFMKIAFRSNKPEAEEFTDKVCDFLSDYRKGHVASPEPVAQVNALQFPPEMTVETRALTESFMLGGASRRRAWEKAISIIATKYDFVPPTQTPPKQISQSSGERYLTPTEIGKRLGGLSAIAINRHLYHMGYQLKNQENKWALTEIGKEYGRIEDEEKAHCVGTIQQLKWRESVIEKIVEAKVS
jgi:hypothetical protein